MAAIGTSLWSGVGTAPRFEALPGDIETDVAIVGGGIVGTTLALLLRERGVPVALLEARRVGEQITGGSSAKVTSQHSLIYQRLAGTFDEMVARAYGEANQWAVGDIEARVRDLRIDCAFQRRAAYTYTVDEDRVEDLRAEAELASRLGLPARFVTDVPLPFPTRGALVFDEQAQFDSLAYLRGIASTARAAGARIFEGARVTGLDDGEDHRGPVRLQTERGSVHARDVVIASGLPFIDDVAYFSRAVPRAHLVIAGRVPAPALDGIFISIDDPTRSLRAAHGGGANWVLLVGPAFTPGDVDTPAALEELERFLRAHFPVQAIDYRWWNEDYYSIDGLPFVGRLEADRPHAFVATGFGGWGITNGHVAAQILADAVQAIEHPWAQTFDATRTSPATDTSPLAQLGRFVRGNLATAKELAARIAPHEREDVAHLAPGEGDVFDLDGERVGVARGDDGTLHAVSAICTHLGCEVAWNAAMRTWDCGCHGSCFDLDGAVLRGPALRPLVRSERGVAASGSA